MMVAGTSRKKISAEAGLLAAVLGAIAVIAFIVLVFADWTAELRLEAAKTALTVLAVSFFGVLATLVASLYQQRRKDEAERRIRREEEQLRRIERSRDARSREDELLRSLLRDTIR